MEHFLAVLATGNDFLDALIEITRIFINKVNVVRRIARCVVGEVTRTAHQLHKPTDIRLAILIYKAERTRVVCLRYAVTIRNLYLIISVELEAHLRVSTLNSTIGEVNQIALAIKVLTRQVVVAGEGECIIGVH